jgi:hypothetical protein
MEPVSISKAVDMTKTIKAQSYIDCSVKIQYNVKEVFSSIGCTKKGCYTEENWVLARVNFPQFHSFFISCLFLIPEIVYIYV